MLRQPEFAEQELVNLLETYRENPVSTFETYAYFGVSDDEAAALLLHGSGVHVERRMRGDELDDPLLGGMGLAGYLDAEEGMAKVFEEVVTSE